MLSEPICTATVVIVKITAGGPSFGSSTSACGWLLGTRLDIAWHLLPPVLLLLLLPLLLLRLAPPRRPIYCHRRPAVKAPRRLSPRVCSSRALGVAPCSRPAGLISRSLQGAVTMGSDCAPATSAATAVTTIIPAAAADIGPVAITAAAASAAAAVAAAAVAAATGAACAYNAAGDALESGWLCTNVGEDAKQVRTAALTQKHVVGVLPFDGLFDGGLSSAAALCGGVASLGRELAGVAHGDAANCIPDSLG